MSDILWEMLLAKILGKKKGKKSFQCFLKMMWEKDMSTSIIIRGNQILKSSESGEINFGERALLICMK